MKLDKYTKNNLRGYPAWQWLLALAFIIVWQVTYQACIWMGWPTVGSILGGWSVPGEAAG